MSKSALGKGLESLLRVDPKSDQAPSLEHDNSRLKNKNFDKGFTSILQGKSQPSPNQDSPPLAYSPGAEASSGSATGFSPVVLLVSDLALLIAAVLVFSELPKPIAWPGVASLVIIVSTATYYGVMAAIERARREPPASQNHSSSGTKKAPATISIRLRNVLKK